MGNELQEGEPRIGNLMDGDESTPKLSVTLERKGDETTLRVPYSHMDETRVYARWFAPGARFDDDPDRTKFRYEVPEELWFRDSSGLVHLLGCRFAGSTSNLFEGIGTIRADTAVLDSAPGSESFESIAGLRSSVSGLRAWLGVTSIQSDRTVAPNGLNTSATYTLTSPEDTDIPALPGLRLVPHWRTSKADDVVSLHDELYVETVFEEQKDWNDHLRIHRGIRDLLVVSRWRREGISDLHASQTSAQDPSTGAWKTVVSRYVDRPVPVETGHRRDLIHFADIGPEGIGKWQALREEFARAVDPFVSSVSMEQAPIETLMSQAGIGLEALGYLLAQRDRGMTDTQANGLKYTDRFAIIGDQISAVAPFDVSQWAAGAANTYNDVKHANRDLPDIVEVANRWRESVLAFRCWTALELGVDPQVLKERVEIDPMSNPYV